MNYDKLTKEQLLGIHKDTLEYLKEQEKEIERLKESEEYHRKGFAELHKRIDETIKYIEEHTYIAGDEQYFVMNSEPIVLLEILKGEDDD